VTQWRLIVVVVVWQRHILGNSVIELLGTVGLLSLVVPPPFLVMGRISTHFFAKQIILIKEQLTVVAHLSVETIEICWNLVFLVLGVEVWVSSVIIELSGGLSFVCHIPEDVLLLRAGTISVGPELELLVTSLDWGTVWSLIFLLCNGLLGSSSLGGLLSLLGALRFLCALLCLGFGLGCLLLGLRFLFWCSFLFTKGISQLLIESLLHGVLSILLNIPSIVMVSWGLITFV
jgi:hypothetical protein